MLEYLVFRLLSLIAPVVPPGLAYRLCERIGDLLYHLLRRRRESVLQNLRVVLSGRPDGVERLAREVFREGVKYYYDTFRVPSLTDSDLERMITIDGWEHLERAVAAGRGAMIATAHLGSPALVAQILAVRGYRVTTPMEAVRSKKLFDLMVQVRGSRGIKMLPLGPRSGRDLLESLRRNEVLGLIVDRDVQKTGVRVRFFGADVTMASGPVWLALKTGAALLPAYTYRCSDQRFVGYIGESLQMMRTGDLREDVRLNTQKLADLLQAAIGKRPEQWIVFEPVWPAASGETSAGRSH